MSSAGLPTTRLTSPSDRWEYRVMSLSVGSFFGPDVNISKLGAYLDSVGDEGWELVTVTPITNNQGGTTALMGFFKRLLPH